MIRRPVVVAALAAVIGVGQLAAGSTANADTSYDQAGQWNGYKVYLSKGCHDGNDGTPGGGCITNTGCAGYSENQNSGKVATATAVGTSSGALPAQYAPLVSRGYKVRIGTGTLSQNVANSNAYNADVHVPIHSNAQGKDSCASSAEPGNKASNNGTWGLWYQSNDKSCATRLVSVVGAASPGTTDKLVYRDNLGELKQPTAPSCYLEAEFHTWTKGKNWLVDYAAWSYRLAVAIDGFFGYPRAT